MKIKLLSVVLLCIVLSNDALGQKGKLKVKEARSKVMKVKAGETIDISKLSNGQLLVLGQKMYTYPGPYSPIYLYTVGEDMTVKKSNELPGSLLKKRIIYRKLMKIDKKFYVFFSFLNTTQKKDYLFYVQVDPSDLSFSGKPFKVAEVPYKGRKFNPGYYTIEMSENDKFIVVTGVDPTPRERRRRIFTTVSRLAEEKMRKTTLKSFSFWLLDKNMVVINHRSNFKVDSKSGNKLYVKRFRSDAEGTMFVVAENEKRVTTTKKQSKKAGRKTTEKIENLSYSVFRLGKDAEDEIEYETEGELLIMDLNLGFSKDGEYVDLVGILYEDVIGLDVATGIHATRLNKKTMEEVSNETSVFDPEMIKKINKSQIDAAKKYGAKKKSSKKKKAAKEVVKYYENGITNLNTVIAVTYTEDGKISAILEKQWLEIIAVTTYSDNVGSRTTYYYVWHYGDLILAAGLGDPDEDPRMDFIDKNDWGLIKYDKGVITSFDGSSWYLMAQAAVYKVDPESLNYSTYVVGTKAAGKGGKIKKSSGKNWDSYGRTYSLSNSVFQNIYEIGQKEFVGIQLRTRKKLVMVKLTAE
jgi:hypothetical protein